MNYAKGFTLVELMIAVAIIGILSAVAIPSYSNYVVRGKLVEATGELANGRIRLEQFFQDNRAYDATGTPCPAATRYFTYACVTAPTTYTITAASVANQGLGAAGDYTYTINESNDKRTTKFKGVASTATCWQMKEGETC